MSETAFKIRSYGGSALPCYLSAQMQPGDLSFTVVGSFSSWTEASGSALGTSGNFIVEVDKGLSTAEKIECSSINLTTGLVEVATWSGGNGRGYDKSTAQVHQPQSLQGGPCLPVWSATEASEANAAAAVASGLISVTTSDTITLAGGYAVDCTGGNLTQTLSTPSQGLRIRLLRVDSTTHTLTIASGADFYGPGFGSGVTSFVLNQQWAWIEVLGDGAAWHVVGGAADTGWVAPTFTNSWANVGSPNFNAAYRKVGNIVRLRGAINSGASATSAFTLPSGLIPSANLGLAVLVYDSGTNNTVAGFLNVSSGGQVVPVYATGATAIFLDGTAWLVD